MFSLLLPIIYLAFISLGLPDSLLGSAWPVMYRELDISVSYAGLVTTLISVGTIVSSLFSDRLNRKLGAGKVTTYSVFLTALALFGFSRSSSFWQLCLWAIPYGLGAGAVDAALNLYVALHYSSKHMSWLHCSWGIGAAISPYIMSYHLLHGENWQGGYQSVGILQICLTVILFVSLPLWKMQKNSFKRLENKKTPKSVTATKKVISKPLKMTEIFQLKGIKLVLITFFAYCALESTTGLWAATFLVQGRGVNPQLAASFASLFYLGITFGRFLSGFVADHLGNKQLIRFGTITLMVGIILILLPVSNYYFSLVGLLIVGLGGAPIYPAIIHGTPDNFGVENSQSVIGIQMAFAYMGTTLVPPLFGFLGQTISLGIYPIYLLFFASLLLFASERLRRVLK